MKETTRDFQDSLAIGQGAEHRIAARLKQIGLDVWHGIGKDSRGDIRMCDTLLEVKMDSKAIDTKNLFCELESNGVPSGLQTTSARLWAFELSDGSCVLIATEMLRALAKSCHKTAAAHGKNRGALVPIDEVLKHGGLWLTAEQMAATGKDTHE